MQRSSSDSPLDASGPGERARSPMPHIGDADNVQKTTWVTGGSGTDPDRDQDKPVIASVPSGGGVNLGAWAVGVIALVIALVYAVGIFR